MLSKVFISLLAFLTLVDFSMGATSQKSKEFDAYKEKYGKKYRNAEEEVYRQLILQKNTGKIREQNQKQGKRYSLGLNRFADMSPEEFRQNYATLYVSDKIVKEYIKEVEMKEQLERKDCQCKVENQFQ